MKVTCQGLSAGQTAACQIIQAYVAAAVSDIEESAPGLMDRAVIGLTVDFPEEKGKKSEG